MTLRKSAQRDALFIDPISGPEARLANGMRMPPGQVVSHAYLLDDAPPGKRWFTDWFPRSRDESDVRERARRCVDAIVAANRGYLLRTPEGVLALPAHDGERPVTLLFSSTTLARTFCKEAGFEGEPEEISIQELVNELLPSKVEDDGLIGLDWTPDLVGTELSAHRLLEVLSGIEP